jgi:uncharacterized cofD-like protein
MLDRSGIRPTRRLPPVGRPPRIVAIGGGTGLAVVLEGLRAAMFDGRGPRPGREDLTAIVNVADDGGSSGRLRRSFGVQPPGDVRRCLLALAAGDPTVSALFGYRFGGAEEVGGHSLGNLLLAALSQLGGNDFVGAVRHASRLLDIRGRVLPSTAERVELEAELEDGRRIAGESSIPAARGRIRRVRVCPEGARALPEACTAVAEADLVVIGPGSLYTSLLPVLALRDLCDAMVESPARVVLVTNLMTEPGETDGYSVADMVGAIRAHVRALPIHHVLVNDAALPADMLSQYAAEHAGPMVADAAATAALGAQVHALDLVGRGPLVRHDPQKLSAAILSLVPAAAAPRPLAANDRP